VTVPDRADDSAAFLRRLEYHENVTVSVEGRAEVDPGVVMPAPSLVVVRMPDAEADYFAHLIARTVRAADALGGVEGIGEPERELADALHEAAATSFRRKCCDLP
jgi:hypothetical protein